MQKHTRKNLKNVFFLRKMSAILFCIYSLINESINATTLNERPENIFSRSYDKFLPPTKKGEPAHVYVEILIMDVDNIDDGKMEYSLQLFLREFWKDDRLNLTEFQIDDDEAPIFPSYLVEHIWVPDIIFDNTKDGKLFYLTLPNTVVKVLRDGTFSKTSRYNLIVNCPMDFHFYPMDTQKCIFRVATFYFTDLKVLLHWSDELITTEYEGGRILLMHKINPLQYELTELVPHKIHEIWPDGNSTILVAKFTFERRLSGALFNVYVPSTLVVLLSWISFWVDVEAVPARITLGVTSLLTLATQIVQAHTGLPPISYLTAIDIWLFCCLMSVFSVLIEYAFAYQFFILIKQPPVSYDQLQSRRFKNLESKIQVLKSRRHEEFGSKSLNCTEFWNNMLEKFKGTKYLDKICRKIFPLIFFLFSLFYWSYFLCNK